jgi:hypothetical protein
VRRARARAHARREALSIAGWGRAEVPSHLPSDYIPVLILSVALPNSRATRDLEAVRLDAPTAPTISGRPAARARGAVANTVCTSAAALRRYRVPRGTSEVATHNSERRTSRTMLVTAIFPSCTTFDHRSIA